MRFVGVLLSLVIIGMLMNIAGSSSMYFDVPSLLLVIVVAAGAVIGRHGFKGFAQIGHKQNNEAVLYTISNAALMAGLIGTFLAMIAMLSHADEIKLISVAPSIAVMLMPSLYAVVLFPLCYTLGEKFEISKGAIGLLLANALVCAIAFASGLSLAFSQLG
jgi:hypothetical protein